MKVIPAMALTAGMLLASACSKDSETQTSSLPGGIKVKRAGDGDKVTFEATAKNGEKTSLTTSAKGMTLPDDFPKDVPVHPKGLVQLLNKIDDTTQMGVLVALPAADVNSYYEAEFQKQGWANPKGLPMGKAWMMSPSKDKRSATVMIAPQDDKTTFVQLTLSPKD